ncbi:MAG: hypothetical protein J6N15_07515 [Ruminiclostridium sp.]|nr:hypothetical protein [Ruminiclostridium sp.]
MKKQLNPWIVAVVFLIFTAAGIAYTVFCLNVIDFSFTESGSYGSSDKVTAQLSEDHSMNVTDRGSADKLEGKTAFVLIFADDNGGKWDRSSDFFYECRRNMFDHIIETAAWLTAQGEAFGKKLEFAYPENENDSLLYYDADIDTPSIANSTERYHFAHSGEKVWDYIDSNVKNDEIKSSLSCDNVVYLICTTSDEIVASSAFGVYDRDLEKPYEFAVLHFCSDKDSYTVAPSTVAHETLHLFGAADLYKADVLGIGYRITDEVVNYVGTYYPDDIMYSTYDAVTGVKYEDKITQKITDATAYYLGWGGAVYDVDALGLTHSQFDTKTE